jgi:hypothetical protein
VRDLDHRSGTAEVSTFPRLSKNKPGEPFPIDMAWHSKSRKITVLWLGIPQLFPTKEIRKSLHICRLEDAGSKILEAEPQKVSDKEIP